MINNSNNYTDVVSILKQHNDRGHKKSTGRDLSDDDVRRERVCMTHDSAA